MCRHLGYLGPAVPVSGLVLDPPHSLLRQSWAPTDMRRGGTINADGFGVGWYTDTPEPVDWRRDGKAGYAPAVPPVVYRRSTPMWTDAALPGLLQPVRATVVLAAV